MKYCVKKKLNFHKERLSNTILKRYFPNRSTKFLDNVAMLEEVKIARAKLQVLFKYDQVRKECPGYRGACRERIKYLDYVILGVHRGAGGQVVARNCWYGYN